MRKRPIRVAVLTAASAVALTACTSSKGGSATDTTSDTAAPGSQSGSVATAKGLEAAYVKVVEDVRDSVVQITTSSGLGSGIVYDSKGDIVTNDHVVGDAKTFDVQFATGGKSAKATLVGTYAPDDLAVIKVPASSGLHPAKFGNSGGLQVGDIVLAIGNPLGFSSSVTSGIISATGRTVVEPQQPPSPGGTIANAIQTSAPINPGNSGGALVNLDSQVIGIPTLAAQDPQIGGAAVGIGFAIPSNTVTDIAGQIIAHGHVVNSHRADLGIEAFTVTDAFGNPAGVGVYSLLSGGPAQKAGIPKGSIITEVDGQKVTSVSALNVVLVGLKPGQTVKVKYTAPDGGNHTVNVTLGTLP